MGRKHLGTRQYIYICLAGIIIALLAGCAALEKRQLRQTADDYLAQGRKLLYDKDFEGALRENRKVLSLFVKGPPGDEALFNMGLIYTHYDNPGRDDEKALGYFRMLIKDYPFSPRAEEAKVWTDVLNELISLKTKDTQIILPETEERRLTDEEESLIKGWRLLRKGNYKGALEESNKVMSSTHKDAPFDKALFNIGLIYAHNDNPEKDYKKSIDYFKRLINKYPESPFVVQAKIWISVLDVIEKAKQVDIEIEEKKKELTR